MSKQNYRRLGDYIREVDVRNRDLEVKELLGINIGKYFMPSVANVVGTDLSNYKIVYKNQFACNLMHVGRDEKIPIAILDDFESAIVSPAYFTFEISDYDVLLPQYLMMWFRKPEFDREAWFYTDGDVRGGMSKSALLDMSLPVPPIEQQRKIVAEYEAVSRRIRLNEQMITRLEETAQALYHKMFVDGIDKENLPEGWRMGTLGEVAMYVDEKISLDNVRNSVYISTETMLKDRKGIALSTNMPESGRGTKFKRDDILISNIRPYFKKIWKASYAGACSNDILCLRSKNGFKSSLLYSILEQDIFFDYVMAGSNGVKMPRGDKKWIMNYNIIIPTIELVEIYDSIISCFDVCSTNYRTENLKLLELQFLFLSKIG